MFWEFLHLCHSGTWGDVIELVAAGLIIMIHKHSHSLIPIKLLNLSKGLLGWDSYYNRTMKVDSPKNLCLFAFRPFSLLPLTLYQSRSVWKENVTSVFCHFWDIKDSGLHFEFILPTCNLSLFSHPWQLWYSAACEENWAVNWEVLKAKNCILELVLPSMSSSWQNPSNNYKTIPGSYPSPIQTFK